MLEKRRSGRASTKTSIEDEIAHLRGLDLKGLRSRWQSVFQRPPPNHLPRHLLFAIIAYRIQADRLGDLEPIQEELESNESVVIPCSGMIRDRSTKCGSLNTV